MRCGFNKLAAEAESALQDYPFSRHVFAFRGRRGKVIELLRSGGNGLCLFAKRLESDTLRAPSSSSWTARGSRSKWKWFASIPP